MKLKNKKTGEIVSLEGELLFDNEVMLLKQYSSLAELNAEWEDYEEPKGYWYIRDDGSGVGFSPLDDSTVAHRRSIIGNYFESEEEAKRALEKLKAWKRLKDKGFEFCCDIKYESLCGNGFNIPLNAIMPPEAYTDTEVSKDQDLLFGGEE